MDSANRSKVTHRSYMQSLITYLLCKYDTKFPGASRDCSGSPYGIKKAIYYSIIHNLFINEHTIVASLTQMYIYLWKTNGSMVGLHPKFFNDNGNIDSNDFAGNITLTKVDTLKIIASKSTVHSFI